MSVRFELAGTIWEGKLVETADKLEQLASRTVAKDPQIRNCVIALEKGDGSVRWSAAGGIARQDSDTPMTAHTPYFIASITKLFTATAIMRLYEQGHFSLQDPMAQYLPKPLIEGIHIFKGKDYSKEITIEHLLSHSSGIADYYLEKPKGGKSFFEKLLEEPEKAWTVEDTIALARDKLTASFVPGSKAAYADTNYQLLGKIAEAVSHQELHELFALFFFEPLGMDNTWLHKRSEPSQKPEEPVADIHYGDRIISQSKAYESSWADGGLVSTVKDCLIFLKALNSGLVIDKEKTLPLMHQWRRLQFPLQYGYGTMYFKTPRIMTPFRAVPPIWGHSGSTGTFLFYCRALDLYMAGAINQAKSPSKPFRMIVEIMNQVDPDSR